MGRHTPQSRQRKLVELWRRSELSIAAFARGHRVRPGTFATWIERHPPDVVTPPPTQQAFIEVARETTGFTVRVGPHALCFDQPPPASWFAALVREMGSC